MRSELVQAGRAQRGFLLGVVASLRKLPSQLMCRQQSTASDRLFIADDERCVCRRIIAGMRRSSAKAGQRRAHQASNSSNTQHKKPFTALALTGRLA